MAVPPLKPHPEYKRIAAAAVRLFQDGVGVRVQDTVFRAANPKYAELPHLISGRGSWLNGSRWNPPGAMAVLHAADSPEHAVSEALVVYRHFSIPLPRDLHIVVRAIRLDVRQILDLRVGSVRHALGVSSERMLGTDWQSENASGSESVSQAVGRAAADAGFRGLLAPSAAVPEAVNTVVFVDRMGSKDSITLEAAE